MTNRGDEMMARWRAAFEEASAHFVIGDAGPLKDLMSRGEDVTVLGAFGGYVRGWESVAPRLDWASAQFRDGRWSCEGVSAHVSDDVACTVMIERTEALLGQGTEPSLQELRVTHVLRREGEEFKIVHRHADPLRPTQAP